MVESIQSRLDAVARLRRETWLVRSRICATIKECDSNKESRVVSA
jgi:hypothetical protein